jgi:hypothetical protein
MTEHEWQILLEVYDRLEAEIIKDALDAQDIPAELFQEGVSHFIYPVNGPIGKIEICVPPEKLQEALAWLEAYNKDQLRNVADETGNSEIE